MKEAFTLKLNTKVGNKQATLDQLEQNGFLKVEKGMPMVVEDFPDNKDYFDDDMESLTPIPETDETNPVDYDIYVARVQIPVGDSMMFGTVKNRKRDTEDNLIGQTSHNPILDTALYEVELQDGRVKVYHANQIVDSIYARVHYNHGYMLYKMDDIVDDKRDGTAISADDGFVMLRARKARKRTRRG
jgi:hypothetical protein